MDFSPGLDDLPQPISAALQRQAVRVQRHEARDDEGTREVGRQLEAEGRLPASLRLAVEEELQQQRIARDERAFAICFAVSIYPQRASHLGGSLPFRLRAFASWWSAACRYEGADLEQLLLGLGRVPPAEPEESSAPQLGQLGQLVDSLGCVHWSGNLQEQAQRRAGAMLFLATLPSSTIERMCARWWPTESARLEFLLNELPCPPTDRWGRAWESEPLHQWARRLEAMAFAQAHRLALSKDVARQVVGDFWTRTHSRLCSGFPYYCFQARLTSWWSRCLQNSLIRSETPPIRASSASSASSDVSVASADNHAREELDTEQIAEMRECYRLARSTFFARSTANMSEEQAALEHEKLRSAIDELWKRQIDPAGSRSVKEIGESHGLGGHVYTLARRIRIRVAAAGLIHLAKLTRRQTELQIQTLSGSEAAHRTGWEAPAFLALSASQDASLLPTFICSLALRRRVLPQRHDTWSRLRIAREVGDWLRTDESKRDALTSQFAALPGLGELIHDVEAAASSADLEQVIKEEGFSVRLTAAIHALLKRAMAHSTTKVDGIAQSVAQTAAQTAAQAITDAMADTFGRSWQWVSPVWYLYVVQGLDADGIADRLEADAGEAARLESAIEQAVQGMRMFRTCDDT